MTLAGLEFLLFTGLGFLIGYNTHAIYVMAIDLEERARLRNLLYLRNAEEISDDIPVVNGELIEQPRRNVITTHGTLVE